MSKIARLGNPAVRIGIWGATGSGKTTRAKALQRGYKRVIVVDPIGDYGAEGFTAYKGFKAMYQRIMRDWGNGFRASVDVTPDPLGMLNRLSRDLFLIQEPFKTGRDRTPLLLIVDEMSLSVPNKQLPPELCSFQRLCNIGRHYGVHIIGISQRMAEVSTNFRGNTSEDYFFRLRGATDSATALQLIGRQHAGNLRGLADHDFLHFKDGKLTKGRNAF